MRNKQVFITIGAVILSLGAVFLTAGKIIGARLAAPPAPLAAEQEEPKTEQPAAKQNRISVLFCGIDNTSWLTDVIIYGVLDMDLNQVYLLQIPRDSFVGEQYPTGKINAVYGNPSQKGQGIEELKKVLKEQLGLPVDYFVTITLDGFRNVIDSFGGIAIDVPYTIEYLPGKTLYPGLQVLNGQQSEWFVRYRAGYATGDIGRISAQKLFLQSCFETVQSRGTGKALTALAENYSQIKTDMPLNKMLSAAQTVFSLKEKDISVFLAPGSGRQNRSYAVYQWDAEEIAQLLNNYFRPKGEELAAEQLNICQLPEQPVYQLPAQEPPAPQPEPQTGHEPLKEENEEQELQETPLENSENSENSENIENSWADFLNFLDQQAENMAQ